MKTSQKKFVVSVLTLAVQAALCSMVSWVGVAAAAEEDADVATLTQPTNVVEVGVESVSDKSAKFGEYNGLNKAGAYAIGNFKLRGGNAYGTDAANQGVNRWQLEGADLGTTSRSFGANVSNQGQWDFALTFDQLRHHSTDSYQTPFLGSMGGNSFILPPSFGVIDATHAGDTGTGTQALTTAQQAAFQSQDVYTDRKKTGLTGTYNFDRRWSVQFDYNRLIQSGAKLIGASFSPDAAGAGAGENSATLMNPTHYRTDTFDFALNWVGEQGHLKTSYFASVFKDGYSELSWSNPFVDNGLGNGLAPDGGVFPVNSFATAPSNTLHQLNLSGGYAFSSATKIAGGLSFGRTTQNSSFINDPLLTSALPRSSLGGLVLTNHADVKLTNQTSRNLSLSAGLRYNERDNRTPSSSYDSFVSVAGDPWGAVVNAPVSNKKTQLELAGNYRVDKKQSLRLAYEHVAVSRWCNNALANAAQSADVLTNYPSYYATAACVQSPRSKEDKLTTGYKLKAGNSVGLTAGYVYAKRQADFNSSYYNPMQTSAEGLQNLGFVPYFDATRTEQLFKAGINWQADTRLNVALNGRYVDDKYGSTLGVQKGHAWGMNLDVSYHYSDNGSVSSYLSAQRRQRDLLVGAEQLPMAASTQLWSNVLTDDTDSFGVTAKQKGLMGGKLELTGDLSYSLSKSAYTTSLVNYTSVLCDPYGISCGSLPAIKNELLKLKLAATYQVDKTSQVAVGYVYKKLRSDDYYYSAYQLGSTDVTVMPTNQLAPNHAVNVLGVSYIYSFR